MKEMYAQDTLTLNKWLREVDGQIHQMKTVTTTFEARLRQHSKKHDKLISINTEYR